MRGGRAFFTVIALWAQELGDGSPGAAFQTIKPLRKVFIGKVTGLFLDSTSGKVIQNKGEFIGMVI